MKKLFEGFCTALITPFKKGKIDFEKLAELIEFQILADASAILVLGTTGESATISVAERNKIIKFAKEKIENRCLLLVGTGSNCTKTAVSFSKTAQKLGADGVLVVTPYYNKCTQEGLYMHYSTIAKAINIPLILYNVPSRTAVNIQPETAERLSEISNIVGIKEANSDHLHISKMFHSLRNRMAIYCGNDDLNFLFYTCGAMGVISVTGNLYPEMVSQVCRLCKNFEFKDAEILHNQLQGINKSLFIEVNPIPVKYGASKILNCENELRLPLTTIEESNKKIIDEEMEKIK